MDCDLDKIVEYLAAIDVKKVSFEWYFDGLILNGVSDEEIQRCFLKVVKAKVPKKVASK